MSSAQPLEAMALLKRLEWASSRQYLDGSCWSVCPLCGGEYPNHCFDCDLGRFIGSFSKEESK